MKININFDEASSGLIPEGTYLVSVMEAISGTSQSGKDKITVKLEIEQGKYQGRLLWDNLSLSVNAIWRLQKFIGSLGLPNTGDQKIDTDEWIGRKLIVLTRKSVYEGREFLKITDFKRGVPEDLDKGMAKDGTTKAEEITEELKTIKQTKETKDGTTKAKEITEELKDLIG